MKVAITGIYNAILFKSKSNLFRTNSYLIAIFILAECIVNPIGDFPLNDDWSYAKSVKILLDQHRLDIGLWPAMTLATHIVWGFLFSTCFGFSFTVLRFSTLLSSLIGVLVMNKLVFKISENQKTAFIASLALLFNPLHFNMSNTFMTDVNFNTLFLLGIYFAYDFFKNGNKLALVLVFIISIFLVLLRQFGIILPFCFFIACFFIDKNKLLISALAFCLCLVVFLTFKYYEGFLKLNLTADAAYKFSGNVNPTQRLFWDIIFENLPKRYFMILSHVLVYSVPLALLMLPALSKPFSKIKLAVAFLFLYAVVLFIGKDKSFQMSNVFGGMSLGTETFFQTLTGSDGGTLHNDPPIFELIMPFVASLFISITLMVMLLFLIVNYKKKTLNLSANSIFLTLLFITYAVMMLVTESYFDRYHLPLISLTIIFISDFRLPVFKISFLCQFIIILFFYVSVFGTKDYLTVHRTIWQAYHELRKDPSIKPESVNAGFEIYNWNDGETFNFWWEFSNLKNFNYIIQYDKEPGFEKYKTYSFQRYFPYKEDEINIFVRTNALK